MMSACPDLNLEPRGHDRYCHWETTRLKRT
jgi:hypothetical protein